MLNIILQKDIMKNKYKILSVGGSIVIPKAGFNIPFLKNFRAIVLNEVKRGQKFILVVGGGATCRVYQKALSEVVPGTSQDLDYLGIASTHFNAEFVRLLFGSVAYSEIIKNPTKKIKTSKAIIIAGGWKPGCSTDTDAVLLAKNFGADEIINLSNIDYVYDSDPHTNSRAKKFTQLSWKELRVIVGNTWNPGAHVPFDPLAAKLAQHLRLRVRFVLGTNLKQVRQVLQGKKHEGTLIVAA
jgi:uridylate kinase